MVKSSWVTIQRTLKQTAKDSKANNNTTILEGLGYIIAEKEYQSVKLIHDPKRNIFYFINDNGDDINPQLEKPIMIDDRPVFLNFGVLKLCHQSTIYVEKTDNNFHQERFYVDRNQWLPYFGGHIEPKIKDLLQASNPSENEEEDSVAAQLAWG